MAALQEGSQSPNMWSQFYASAIFTVDLSTDIQQSKSVIRFVIDNR